MPTDIQRDIAHAADILRSGGLVAFPTETVYGLGADASNPDAVRKIFAAKGRPADHPVIVHLPSAHHPDSWAQSVPDAVHQLADAFWPGPLTLILRRAANVSDAVTGGQDTVGLRVPGHPLALELLEAFGGGIAAPSANRFGRVSPTTAAHVRAELGDSVDFVLDGGPCAVGLESTILDLSGDTPRLLRPGHISPAQLTEVLGTGVLGEVMTTKDAPRAPGTLESHYAPSTPVVIAESLTNYLNTNPNKTLAVLARSQQPAWLESEQWRILSGEPDSYGRGLYAALRELDAVGCDEIVVEAVPDTPEWLAVRDRLRRAAKEVVRYDGSF